MSAEHVAIAIQMVEQVWNCGQLDLIPDLLSPNHVYLDPSNQQTRGHQAFRRHVSAYRSAFPNLHMDIEASEVIGDEVTVQWTMTGVPNGDRPGTTGDGGSPPAIGTTIYRFVGDKIVESWTHWDTQGMLYFADIDRAAGAN